MAKGSGGGGRVGRSTPQAQRSAFQRPTTRRSAAEERLFSQLGNDGSSYQGPTTGFRRPGGGGFGSNG